MASVRLLARAWRVIRALLATAGAVTRQRIYTSVQLHADGFAPIVIFTGRGNAKVSEAEIYADAAEWLGLPGDAIRMAQAGILAPGDRVELIEGEVVALTPVGPRRNAAVDRGNRVLSRAAGDQAIVRVQGSIRLNRFTEPEPDLALLRPREDFYATGMPGPTDVLDTATLTPGLHTIAWRITDSAGNTQGIGSRYFFVQN